MSGKTKEVFRRFFKLRNVVPFLIIVVAFVATFFTTPFGLQRDQILLALLAFLAIDAIIERTEMLTNIENDVRSLKEFVTSQTAGEDFLRFRSDFPRIEHLINEAKQEIWLSGIAMDTMARLTGVFNSKLEQGFKLRFLMVDPTENTLKEMGEYFGEDAGDLEARITTSINNFYRKLVQTYPEQVELRLTGHRPNLGYFIVDPHHDQGYMTVEPYLYMTESTQRPMFLLSQKGSSPWFSIYLADFKVLWNDAKKWEP